MSTRVLTVSGEIATGKSTIVAALLKKLSQWSKVNTGEIFREICANRGWSIQEVSFIPDELHKEVDEQQRQLALSGSQIIIESRLIGWLTRDASDVFSVFCYAPLEVRTQRYISREGVSLEKAIQEIKYRDEKDLLKFRSMYDLDDYRSNKFYNLMLDTSTGTPDELATLIMDTAHLTEQNPE